VQRAIGLTLILAGLLLVVIGIAGAITWGNADLAPSAPFLVGGAIALLGLFVEVVGWAVLRGRWT
jgi:hypothetical protein